MSSVFHALAKPVYRAAISPFLGKPKLVCIFGAMRSGSTLLTEILRSNEDIAGFGEAHISYQSKASVAELSYWTLRHTGETGLKARYLLDKILHPQHVPSVQVLEEAAELWPIFLVRQPDGNGASLQRMFSRQRDHDVDVNRLLLNRYAELSSLASALTDTSRMVALSYEALTSSPNAVLESLTTHLGLPTPLEENYGVSDKTGNWGTGDGSANIRSGRIKASTPGSDDRFTPSNEVVSQFRSLTQLLSAKAQLSLLEPSEGRASSKL